MMTTEVAVRRLLESLAVLARDDTRFPGDVDALPFMAAHIDQARRLAETENMPMFAAVNAALVDVLEAVWNDHHAQEGVR